MVYPIVLGGAKRLFAEGIPRTAFRLVGTKPVGEEGIIILTSQPVR